MSDATRFERPVKRSVSIQGHRTSVALETAFWRVIDKEARRRGGSLAALIGEIDARRSAVAPDVGLASALRQAALSWTASSRTASSTETEPSDAAPAGPRSTAQSG